MLLLFLGSLLGFYSQHKGRENSVAEFQVWFHYFHAVYHLENHLTSLNLNCYLSKG